MRLTENVFHTQDIYSEKILLCNSHIESAKKGIMNRFIHKSEVKDRICIRFNEERREAEFLGERLYNF